MVQQYKGKTPSPADVGMDLSVMSVVMGRISLQGEDLSISVEIVDTRDNSIIVSNQYFAKLYDLAGIQTRIAKDITDKFSFQLTKQALLAGF